MFVSSASLPRAPPSVRQLPRSNIKPRRVCVVRNNKSEGVPEGAPAGPASPASPASPEDKPAAKSGLIGVETESKESGQPNAATTPVTTASDWVSDKGKSGDWTGPSKQGVAYGVALGLVVVGVGAGFLSQGLPRLRSRLAANKVITTTTAVQVAAAPPALPKATTKNSPAVSPRALENFGREAEAVKEPFGWPPEAVDTRGASEWADADADGTAARVGPDAANKRQESQPSGSAGRNGAAGQSAKGAGTTNGNGGSAAQGARAPGDVQGQRQQAGNASRQGPQQQQQAPASAQGALSSTTAAAAAARSSAAAPPIPGEPAKAASPSARGDPQQAASAVPSEAVRGEGGGAAGDLRRERARRRAERKQQQEEFKQPFRGIEHSEAHVIMVLRAAATAQAAAAEAAEAASHAATAAADAMAASARVQTAMSAPADDESRRFIEMDTNTVLVARRAAGHAAAAAAQAAKDAADAARGASRSVQPPQQQGAAATTAAASK